MKALLICAWCDEKMGDTDTPDGEPSHGICLPCLKARYPDLHQAIIADRPPETARQTTPSHSDPAHDT